MPRIAPFGVLRTLTLLTNVICLVLVVGSETRVGVSAGVGPGRGVGSGL